MWNRLVQIFWLLIGIYLCGMALLAVLFNPFVAILILAGALLCYRMAESYDQ